MTLSSCSNSEHINRPVDSIARSTTAPAPTTRQTDANGVSLPFKTKFTHRWNSNNDGTLYEPCTAVNAEVLSKFNLSAQTARDVALADQQTARGCDWETEGDPFSSITQSVGNAPSLTEYKARQSGHMKWLPDVELANRSVAVGIITSGECTTYVASGTAVVATSATFHIDLPPEDQVCAKAIAFTAATINKMPP
ncbi:DUF3558 family protein [Gordonia polyisoprenivorans]|uniref:DUF3558 family protein n=1 Tax=Gordonia polyisoprenivorans TaxID=84595 RepID=A0A846WJD9_9ACTN|nr:DUF3558 family protein [Gordonia polyisoprenivorans]NKY00491.1 DUF3558 family protein [Gordonia polyisoprenivorans]QUD81648.1 DUF3558 family protein [Gordonia polyisoprenivorans]